MKNFQGRIVVIICVGASLLVHTHYPLSVIRYLTTHLEAFKIYKELAKLMHCSDSAYASVQGHIIEGARPSPS